MAQESAAQAPVVDLQRRRPIRWRRWLGLSFPALIVTLLLVGGIGADWLAPHDPEFLDIAVRLEPPVFDGGSWDYPLGTDKLGRDIFSRLLHGARVSLIVVAVVVPGAALSFLTVGVPPGTSTWGAMITEGRETMNVAWWPIWLPGLALLTISLTGNVMGDWLRDALDPRLRNVR